MSPILELDDLRVWYGTPRGAVRAVDGVSLSIGPGESVGLVGESGCGKSTLGRGIVGLLPPDTGVDGEVRFRGQNLVGRPTAELREIRGPGIGLIFQEPMTRLNPLMKVSEHFAETLRAHESGISKKEVRSRSLEALRGMGIPPTRFDHYPHEFSGGMRQRIMIALVLVLRPALVIADEPTTALDVLVEAQILSILADLRRNFDTALLLITHNLGIIAEACDQVAVMYAGRLAEFGEARKVFTDPAHPYTRALLASTISLRTTELTFIPGAPPDLGDPPGGCRFHPRCAAAMVQCERDEPIEVRTDAGRVACWLHGPDTGQSAADRAPLLREEIASADEA
jgi:peptide/nickel transport system ATP-binding protein